MVFYNDTIRTRQYHVFSVSVFIASEYNVFYKTIVGTFWGVTFYVIFIKTALSFQKDRQCTCDVMLRSAKVTSIAVEEQ
jgi:hypothetical protein